MTVSVEVFLDSLLPKGNRYIGFTDGTKNKAGREMIKCSSFEDAAHGARIGYSHGQKDHNVYFALASFKQAKIYDAEKGYEKSYRHQENVDKLKAVWLDVDFKNYASPKATIEAIAEFLGTPIPKPTYVVSTGGGIHLYWAFEEELRLDRWTVLAQGLAGYAKHCGLRADFGVTIDSARVLRLPGTRNQKYPSKPECRIEKMNAYVSVDRMFELLSAYAAASHTPRQAPIVASSNVVNLFNPAANADLKQNYTPGLKSRFEHIVKGCATLRETLETQGANDNYPRWKNVLHLLAYTEDGADYIHEVSRGYPGYDPIETQARYDESVAVRAADSRGPTTCAVFSATSTKCNSCPYLGKIASPWSLGKEEHTETSEPSFVMNGGTHIMQFKPDENGNMVAEKVRIAPMELDNFQLMETTDPEAPFELWFTARNGKALTHAKMSTGSLVDPRTFRSKLLAYYIALTKTEVLKVQELCMAWVQHLAKIKGVEEVNQFGWSKNRDAFVLGASKLTGLGSVPVVQTKFKEDYYAPVGTIDPWRKLAQKLLDHDNPAYTYMLCAGMAGPIMGVLHRPASMVVSVYSQKSGAGKTTVMECIQAAFGHPAKGMFAMDDTANSIIERVGTTQGLPALWDEIKGDNAARNVTEIIFRFMQRKSKQRLSKDIKLSDVHDIYALMMCATNIPLVDYVNQQVNQTDAGLARFLEFEISGGISIDDDIDAYRHQLANNYGHAGREFITYVINNYRALCETEKTWADFLNKKRQWKSTERFWKDGTAKILTAAWILEKAGLAKVDMRKLVDFCFKVIEGQRSFIEDMNDSTDELISNMVRFHMDEVLITQSFSDNRNTVQVLKPPARHKVVVHISVAQQKVRIMRSAINEYAILKHLSGSQIVDHMKRVHGASTVLKNLGAGTQFAQAQQHAVEFPSSALGDDMLAAWLPATSSTSQNATPGSSTGAQP